MGCAKWENKVKPTKPRYKCPLRTSHFAFQFAKANAFANYNLSLFIANPHIKKATTQVKLNLNKSNPHKYATCEIGYVLYKART